MLLQLTPGAVPYTILSNADPVPPRAVSRRDAHRSRSSKPSRSYSQQSYRSDTMIDHQSYREQLHHSAEQLEVENWEMEPQMGPPQTNDQWDKRSLSDALTNKEQRSDVLQEYSTLLEGRLREVEIRRGLL